jgi:hypothetical protein
MTDMKCHPFFESSYLIYRTLFYVIENFNEISYYIKKLPYQI